MQSHRSCERGEKMCEMSEEWRMKSNWRLEAEWGRSKKVEEVVEGWHWDTQGRGRFEAPEDSIETIKGILEQPKSRAGEVKSSERKTAELSRLRCSNPTQMTLSNSKTHKNVNFCHSPLVSVTSVVKCCAPRSFHCLSFRLHLIIH